MALDWDVYLSCCSEHGEKDARGVSSSREGGAVAAAGLGQQGGGSGEQNLFQAAGSVQRRGGKHCLTHPTRHQGYG